MKGYDIGLTVIVMGLGLSYFANQAGANTVPLQPKSQVKSDCAAAGGVYVSKMRNGVYGCMNPDTSGIVCGGKGSYANTCSTFRKVPPQLPTREALTKFEAETEAAKK